MREGVPLQRDTCLTWCETEVKKNTVTLVAALAGIEDLDFYEMFSGCGTLYKEFRGIPNLL